MSVVISGAFIVVTLCAFAFAIGGLFTRRRPIGSRLISASLSLFLALFASAGAMHAWGESKSVPSTIGYGEFAVLSIAVAVWIFRPT